jgi:AcrR family transcriptional regulator
VPEQGADVNQTVYTVSVPYDPDATRARILAAAEQELAAYGPAGARIERIASEAGVNKQGIYHHFGDKNQLLAIVLRRRLDELADAIPIDPAGVDAYAGELFDFHVAHPELVRLVLWEGLSSQDGPVVDEVARREHYRIKTAALAKAQANEHVDPSLDTRQIVLAILSLINWQMSATQVTRMLFESDEETPPPTIAERRAFVVEMTRRMITAPDR